MNQKESKPTNITLDGIRARWRKASPFRATTPDGTGADIDFLLGEIERLQRVIQHGKGCNGTIMHRSMFGVEQIPCGEKHE